MCSSFFLCPLFFGLFLAPSFAQNSSSVELFPPNSKPFGLSYDDHLKKYWNIVLAVKNEENPWNDHTGEMCHKGQESINSSVFYLATNGGGNDTRVCTIPSGLGLFIPVLIGEFSLFESNPGKNPEELVSDAKNDKDSMNIYTLKINDKILNTADMEKYGIVTGLFNLTFGEENVFGTEAGTTLSAADGYSVITKPLAKGTYNIHTHGEMCTTDDGCPRGDNLIPDVKTTLIVK